MSSRSIGKVKLELERHNINASPHQISIVTPSFNAAHTIERMISSVRGSLDVDCELIVIDDCSTDSTSELIGRNIGPDLKLIRHNWNQGPSAARNAGVAAATGKWVALVDADDWIASERLSALAGLAEKHNLDVISDNQYVVNSFGDAVRTRFSTLTGFGQPLSTDVSLISMSALVQHPGIGITQPLIRREFLITHSIRYRTEFNFGEDYRLLFDLVNAGAQFGVIDTPYYYAELTEGSLTSNRVEMFSGMIEVFEDIKAELIENNQPALAAKVEENIQQSRRTVAYGAVMDPLKSGRIITATLNLFRNPSFLAQLPGRIRRIFAK
ncbi:glycosyltransferase family 2 protein [Gimesia maris]|uniref:glycosyltransferase family 2 protein n=1 Tax=Gimesia maris TaxID=122 RepID=UPI003A90DAC6